MEIEMENLMLNFLQRYYPISRIKIKNQMKKTFKRCILFDDGTIYELSNKKAQNHLRNELIKILMVVFNYDETNCKDVLSKFL